jgi:polyribonucleotide 5'-hydroxyl-kinase
VPLVFYYGHVTPGDAPELYRYLVDRMASVLDRRADASPEVRVSGDRRREA